MTIDESAIREACEKHVNGKTPGVSVLIGQRGEICHQSAFGMADIENGVAAETDTKYSVASISKQFTCMGIMMLKERGLLNYDDPAGKYLAGFPAYINHMTIKHLMTHTSGLKEYFGDNVDDAFVDFLSTQTLATMLDVFRGYDKLSFPTGERFEYNNTGYVLLSAIIEKVSGMSHGAFNERYIFGPLGMAESVTPDTAEAPPAKMAAGYEERPAGTFRRQRYDMGLVGWGDGNVVTTCADLFKWHNALYTEKLVKAETLAGMLQNHVTTDRDGVGYGYGIFVDTYKDNKRLYWHTGGNQGFIAKFARYMADDVCVVMLTNYNGIDRDGLFDAIAETVFK